MSVNIFDSNHSLRNNRHRRISSITTHSAMSLCLIFAAIGAVQPGLSQDLTPASSQQVIPSDASAVLHSVVRWNGSLAQASGHAVALHFAIYANQSGGQALWSEVQTVPIGSDGHYSVLLGAATEQGLPQNLFPSDQLRWIEVNIGTPANTTGQPSTESPRSLLAAVPYAFRSVDSESLAGRAATEYVTREDLQSLVASAIPSTMQTAADGHSNALGITPNIAGTGTTGTLALWTASATLGSSNITYLANKIGIGTTAPIATLDVNGTINLRGTASLPATSTATTATGTNSSLFKLGASTYSSAAHAAIAQTFAFQAVSVGNNTTAPAGKLQFLYASGTSSPVATGLSIANNGRITFAPGQTFPGVAGAGTLTAVTASSPLSGGGTGTNGVVTLGLNLTALETSLNTAYARLTAANSFTSSAAFAGPVTGNSGSTMYAIQGNTSSGSGVQGYATGSGGWGVNGYSTGNGGIGVYGNATGNASGANYPIGVLGHAFQGTAIKGVLDEPAGGQSAILGHTNGTSAIYTNFQSDSLAAGVWGDVASIAGLTPMAIAGTTDDGYAGVFENNSTIWPTLFIYNGGSAGKGSFSAMMVGSPGGTCGIGGSGDFSCTGQIKSLVSTQNGERTVETYSVQSAENWMEDFGSGSLHSGSTTVTIDPAFAETVSSTADYRIFITPNGDSKGLFVTNKTATSFEVRESSGGTASIAFDYRIVAKRRGFEAQRLTDVTERFKAETSAAKGPLKSAKLLPEPKP
ncbi:hypothetical protein [Acidicapsa ligni]|uniref:hypothetical protein n=1 Tax=Acidicapsa ligni TaxID=542300 RepID=UPI0021DF708D|nr:hypothetical protein [Acidicapsa ligni]